MAKTNLPPLFSTFSIVSSIALTLISSKSSGSSSIIHSNNNGSESANENFGLKSSALDKPQPMHQVLKRPEIKLSELLKVLNKNGYSKDVIKQVEYEVKYDGYLDRQNAPIQKLAKMENKKIPEQINFSLIKALSTEAREKLSLINPANLGQASRISGVTPADLSVLLI